MTFARTRSGQFTNDTYIPGNAWFTCDRCSQRRRRSDMRVEWDNLRVCGPCEDPRPPMMQPPNVYPEGIPFFDARPPADRPDRLMDDTALQSVTGGMAVQPGVLHPDGQNQLPGALSPLNIYEAIEYEPNAHEPGQPSDIGTPIGPDILADDVTFITGPVPAPTAED